MDRLWTGYGQDMESYGQVMDKILIDYGQVKDRLRTG